jgi:hypothetical protein
MMLKSLLKVLFVSLITMGAYYPLTAQQKSSAYDIVAKDAAWCWFSDPRAVYHKGSREQIYFAYINSKGDVVISSREAKTKQTKNFTLHSALQVDDHNVPSILFLPDGRLLTFYTEHNGRFFMRKSKNPEDITSWEEERVIPFGGTKITYSHPVMLKGENNRIYMFWRGSDWRPSMSYSDDMGETWSTTQALVESKGAKNRPYLKVCSDNKDRIDFAFTDGHPAAEPSNSVYHMYYQKGNFYQSNGEHITAATGLPVEHSKVRKVYDGAAQKVKAWISDIALDKGNKPVLVYVSYPADTDHRYHYAQWDGHKWQNEEICKGGGWMPLVNAGEKVREPNYSGGISLDHQHPANVYLSREINKVFEIEHWKKEKKSWSAKPLTTQSDISSMRPYVVADFPGKKPIVLWMTGLYSHYTKFDTDLRINYER